MASNFVFSCRFVGEQVLRKQFPEVAVVESAGFGIASSSQVVRRSRSVGGWVGGWAGGGGRGGGWVGGCVGKGVGR